MSPTLLGITIKLHVYRKGFHKAVFNPQDNDTVKLKVKETPPVRSQMKNH